VSLVAQWRRIQSELPAEWRDARLSLSVADDARVARAAALLGPAGPGRSDGGLVFTTSRGGGAVGPDAVGRLLQRLDGERIGGTLAVVATGGREAPAAEPVAAATLAAAWDVALAGLPADWSDLLCELEVVSTDYLQRTALLLSPVNPTRDPDTISFRFRVARRFGYGASAPMARRCLARVDEEGIRGRVGILRALSDTHNVATQGPVWYVEGRSV
jgi:hypothetical protein